MSEIKFGTDGWRAVIGREFTEANVARVIQAFCEFQKSAANKVVYVGFDRRKTSDTMAKLAAQILAANGFHVYLSASFCPTPAVSWLVKTQKALCGVVITASHNPPEWNGVKFKESAGSAASPEYTGEIEKFISKNDAEKREILKGDFDALKAQGKIQIFDPHDTYLRHLKTFVNVGAIKKAGYKIAVDPLFGAGTDFIKMALDNQNVVQIHDAADTNFGGLNPEPIEKNLSLLKDTILKEKADVGLATDGDADRIGAFRHDGVFVNSHQIFALLLLHHIRYRKLKGAIVKSISTTQLINKICAKYNFELIETPIGFKYISQELLKRDALMGGEESGGISLREHVHERDGVLNGLLLLEMMALNGKSLAALIADMDKEFGAFSFARDDYHLTDAKIAEVKAKLKSEPIKDVGGIPVTATNTMDGTKYLFQDDSWLLIRASGTEPLLRVYSEATSEARVRELLHCAKSHFQL